MTKKEILLTILGEECSEVQQRCSKAIRFGMDEVQEGQDMDNSQRILYELNDLFAVVEMVYGKDITELIDRESMVLKKMKVRKFMDYSNELGKVENETNDSELPRNETNDRRDCQEVIQRMLKLVPISEEGLINDLLWNYDDAGYKPPEETVQWVRTMNTLKKHMDPYPTEDWQFEIMSIFTTKSVEQIRRMVKEDIRDNRK